MTYVFSDVDEGNQIYQFRHKKRKPIILMLTKQTIFLKFGTASFERQQD